MPSLTSAAVVNPSDLVDYTDTNLILDFLVDENETRPTLAQINSNARAVKFANAAWYEVMEAVRRGDEYTQRQMVDLVNDTVRGQPLIRILADQFYIYCVGRRRYKEGEPEAKDPVYERLENKLQQLRTGERIFVLEGVAISNSDGSLTGGTYGNELAEPTQLQVGQLGASNCANNESRFWGCTDPCRTGSNRSNRFSSNWGGGCGCG